MDDKQNKQDEQTPDIELSKMKKFIKWWFWFIMSISRPYEHNKPNINSIWSAFMNFLYSFTIAGIIIYYLGFANLYSAFNGNETIAIFLTSAFILMCGMYILLMAMSYWFKIKTDKFGLSLAIFVQILYIYAFLIPLLALLFVLSLNQIFLGFLNNFLITLLTISFILLIAIIWIYVFWYGIVAYMTDFFVQNMKSRKVANLISVVALFAILYTGNKIDLSFMAKKVFDADKASEMLLNGLVERGRITQDIANEVMDKYQASKKEYGL